MASITLLLRRGLLLSAHTQNLLFCLGVATQRLLSCLSTRPAACLFFFFGDAFKRLYPHLLKRTSLEGVPGSPGKSQKEGQEDQGEIQELGGTPPAALRSSGPPWSSWPSFLLLPELPGTPSRHLRDELCFQGIEAGLILTSLRKVNLFEGGTQDLKNLGGILGQL